MERAPENFNSGTDLPEEERILGQVGPKMEHFKISRRDTLVNDLKNSTAEGLISFALSVIALILVVAAILVSYSQGGQSRALIGLLPFFALLLAVGALLFAALGFKRKDKVRHYMEKRGLVIALITIAALVYIYIRGLQKVL